MDFGITIKPDNSVASRRDHMCGSHSWLSAEHGALAFAARSIADW